MPARRPSPKPVSHPSSVELVAGRALEHSAPAELDRAELARQVAFGIHTLVARITEGDLMPTTNREATQTLDALTRVARVMQVDTAQLAAAIVHESQKEAQDRYAEILQLYKQTDE